MNGTRITKEQIRACMEVLFYGAPLIQGYDPDLIQVSKDEVRDIIAETIIREGNNQEAMLSCNRAINRLIQRVEDETRGSDYEAYYMEHFGGPGVPPKFVSEDQAEAFLTLG